MEKRKGFTLIELMVVILIVSILAAVAIPIMRGRIDSAKWSEGRAMMGTIATAIRAYCAETDGPPSTGAFAAWGSDLGFIAADLDGTYFDDGDFQITECVYDPCQAVSLQFTIQANNGDLNPTQYTLDEEGTWVASNP